MKTQNTNSFEKLQNGDKVKCLKCSIGYYRPFGKIDNIKKCYHFKCENCGDMLIATKRFPF